MNDVLLKGELLREAACVGDQELLVKLIQQGVDVNSTNSVNGWTALHWACKRGRIDAVRHLCAAGASPDVINLAGETPSQLTTDPALHNILAGDDGKRASTESAVATPTSTTPSTTSTATSTAASTAQSESADLSTFTPSYLRFPTRKVDLGDGLLPTTEQAAVTERSVDVPPVQSDRQRTVTEDKVICLHCCRCCPVYNRSGSDDLVLKVRVSSGVGCDADFVELELPRSDLTWDRLLRVCCRELNINTQVIDRVRKLPNTRLRCDGDVKRLQDYQELELVLRAPSNPSNNSSSKSFNNSIPSHLLY